MKHGEKNLMNILLVEFIFVLNLNKVLFRVEIIELKKLQQLVFIT